MAHAGYGHPGIFDEDADEKLDKIGEKDLKESKLTKFVNKGDDEQKKYQIFDSLICDYVYAARDMYMNGDADFEETIEDLIEVLEKNKGKEEAAMKALKEDEEEDEDDEDDEEDKAEVIEKE